jgi:hypothetical protein
LATVQIRSHIAYHFLLSMRTLPTYRVTFDILVQFLIGIQIRTVAGKIKYPNLLRVPLQPTLRPSRDMDRMLVNDQKEVSWNLSDQAPQELNKDLRSESALEYHEVKPPPIRYCRNHVAAKSLPCSRNHRCLASSPVGAATRMVRPNPHLISPINLSFLLLRQLPNLRIFLLQPPTNLFRILLKCLPNRLLGGKAPSKQIPPNGPDREPNLIFLLNQLSHRFSGPQIKRQLQLVWVAVHHGLGNLSRLPGLKRSSSGSSSLLC